MPMEEGGLEIEQPKQPIAPVETLVDSSGPLELRDMWKVLLACSIIVCEAIGFILLFSDILYGVEVFNELSEHSTTSYVCVCLSLCTFILLYILDFSYWTGTLGTILRRTGMTLVAAGLVIGALLSADKYPELPMAVMFLSMPLTAMVLKPTLFQMHSTVSLLFTMAFRCESQPESQPKLF